MRPSNTQFSGFKQPIADGLNMEISLKNTIATSSDKEEKEENTNLKLDSDGQMGWLCTTSACTQT